MNRAFSFLFSPPQSMPDQVWFIPFLILIVLAGTAFVDARTGRVPDKPLFLGALLALIFSFVFEGQAVALQRSVLALVALVVLWGVNECYYRLFKRDAYGFGDVKWSALAAFVFGLKTIFWAWCGAAWLGLFWIGGRKLLGFIWPRFKGRGYIHFAPFLLIALLCVLFVS